jgi:hypothetical protein
VVSRQENNFCERKSVAELQKNKELSMQLILTGNIENSSLARHGISVQIKETFVILIDKKH